MNIDSAFRGRWARRADPTSPIPMDSRAVSPDHPLHLHNSLPTYTRLPVSPDQQHPLRKLHDLLVYSPHSRHGWFNNTAHATFLRQLFFSIWYKPEWIALFDLDRHPDGVKMPSSKNIHDWIYSDELLNEKPWSLSEYQKRINGKTKRPGKTCGKVMQRMDRTYTCKTCAIDAMSVMCVECFQASDHTGHEVLFGQSFSFATACDCGDPTAWRNNLGCHYHPPHGTPVNTKEVPRELIAAIYDTIIICLEFVIGTLEHAPLPSELTTLPSNLEELLAGFGGTAETKEQRSMGPWSVAVYADEKHTLKEISRQLRDALGVEMEHAEPLAREVDYYGRKVIITCPNPVVSFHAASMFQQIDVGVALRLATDVFREEIVAVIVCWLEDMCQSTIGGDPELFRRLLLHAMVTPRITRPIGLGTPLTPDIRGLSANHDSRRIDWLFQLDTRLWKKPKWELRQVYSNLATLEWESQQMLVSRFAFNIVRIFEHYLFHDRELDTNLAFSITYNIFGGGLATAHATLEMGLLDTLLDIATAWYTDQIADKRLIIPPLVVDRLDTDKSIFRSKKGMTLFGHIKALFRHEEMHRLLLRRPRMLERVWTFFNLFVGLQPQKREMEEHVEYEVDWPRSFQILGELAKMCRELGEGFKHAPPPLLLSTLADLAHRILSDMTMNSTTLDPDRWSRPDEYLVANVLTRGKAFSVLHMYMPLIEAFSFHHYLHYLFAEVSKHLPSIPWGQERYQDLTAVFESMGMDDRLKLMVIEWPLQTHVVLSQIRVDMWKKNGVAMRGQSHHYRDINMRESTIDQDFFLLQLGLCTIDPLKFMVAVIDRWSLNGFFTSSVLEGNTWVEEDCEPRQLVGLLEDFITLVIQLVTETSTINGWSQERITRRHMIHHLALGKLTYAELVKKLPERCTEQSLLPILDEVAVFKPPTDTAVGSYTLKEELYSEVDPYWRYYTRNDARAATKRANMLPRIETPRAPFGNITDFLRSHVVTDIIYWTMAHCMTITDPETWPGLRTGKTEVPQLENLLDLVLHLCLIALQVDPQNFADNSVHIVEQSDSMSIFQNLWLMQTTDSFATFRPRVDHILGEIVKHLPLAYTKDYRAAKVAPQAKPDLRLTAAARQKALLQEFAAKQADFAAMMEEDDDEELEEEEEVGYGSCIVCQEQVSGKAPGGMLALLQPSRMLRETVHDREWFAECLAAPVNLDQSVSHGSPAAYPNTHLRFGVYISACNHLMHDHCVGTYFDATRWRHTQQVQRHHPENAMRMEYLCPLCKSLGNFLIPCVPGTAASEADKLPTLAQSIRRVSEEGLMHVNDSARIWDHHLETGELLPWFVDISFTQATLDPAYRKQKQIKPVSRMIERMQNLLRPLSEQSATTRGSKATMYMPEHVVGYTVSVAEITQRGIGRHGTVAEQVPEIQMTLIKRLIVVLQLELDIYFGSAFDRTALRVGLFARFLPDWYRASSLPVPLLMRDPLGLVIEAAALAPDLLHPVMLMAYFAELTRVMLGLSISIRRSMSKDLQVDDEEALGVFKNFRGCMAQLLRNAGPFGDVNGNLALVGDDVLAKLLYSHTLPFLRRAAIVYYASTGSYANPTAIGGCEYTRLLGLLALPHPVLTLSNPASTETPIVARWLAQWTMGGRMVPHLEYPGVYELAPMPTLFEDVVLKYANVKCSKCQTRPTFPAMCLNCGNFVCLGGDCCSEGEQGECNLHMRECGAGVGLFVDIKRWVLLYLYAGSGSFGHMPYLDSHGDLDLSMRRGHRQYLHQGRWEELRRAWLQHGVPHLTARKLELTSDGGGWTSL